jgi:hypothetical protein
MKVATQTVTIRLPSADRKDQVSGEIGVKAVANETREAPRRRSPPHIAILVADVRER